jgi:pimeloyl-ACP methyl ester carboxylesterase
MARPFPHVDGVSHRHVDAGSLTMHLAEAGPPDADPILILHGWPQHWYEWRHQIPTLAQHYRVIAPDLRGLGWSDAPGTIGAAGSAS